MQKHRRRLLTFLLALLCALPSQGCAGISGQRLETFKQYYEDDLTFINDNANRHLLPLSMARRQSGERDGRLYYEIFGDVLSLTVRTDPTGEVIELCQIIVTAPAGMAVGNAVYNDFAISGYHSYALLMAMDSQADAYDRYAMVNMVESGLQASEGSYATQIGVYALTCTRANATVVMTFENTQAESFAPGDAPAEQTPPEYIPEAIPEGDDEGAGLG